MAKIYRAKASFKIDLNKVKNQVFKEILNKKPAVENKKAKE